MCYCGEKNAGYAVIPMVVSILFILLWRKNRYYVYYVFSIVTERDSFQIVYPQVVN